MHSQWACCVPIFNFFHWTKQKGYYLEQSGPLVPVTVSVPKAMQEYLAQSRSPIPAPVSGNALIDTGAFATAVHEGIFQALGVKPIDVIPTNTPHGQSSSSIYPASISFPALGLTDMPMERIIGCSLNWAGNDESDIIMLLGRDLLKHFLMIYNGSNNDITLSF